MCTLTARHAAALFVCALAAALAMAPSPLSHALWRGLLAFPASAPRDDCFLQQRLSVDGANILHVRAVYVCY